MDPKKENLIHFSKEDSNQTGPRKEKLVSILTSSIICGVWSWKGKPNSFFNRRLQSDTHLEKKN